LIDKQNAMPLERLCKLPPYASLAALAILLVSGCSGDNGRQEISGTVTIDGTPVTMGLINFQPADAAGVRGSGATLRDGRFQLPAAKGLLPGKYVATVQAFRETGRLMDDPMMGKVPQIAPVELAGPPRLEATVVSGDANRFDFQLTSVGAAKH
jgi:hypothetical protein